MSQERLKNGLVMVAEHFMFGWKVNETSSTIKSEAAKEKMDLMNEKVNLRITTNENTSFGAHF